MASSTTSLLFDQVNEALLAEDNFFTIILVDTAGVQHASETPVQLDNPFSFDYSRFAPNQIVMDLPRLLEVAGDVIADAQGREGVVDEQRVQLVSEFPDERNDRFGDEVITWKVIRRYPANMNSSATGRPQRKAQYSYDLRSPHHPNKVVVVETRPIDHIIEFSCWSKNADTANSRALWLERLFITHDWAFKIQGADRFYWQERGIDVYHTSTGGVKLYQRPIRFFVRLVEFQVVAEPVIKHIQFEIHDLQSDS